MNRSVILTACLVVVLPCLGCSGSPHTDPTTDGAIPDGEVRDGEVPDGGIPDGELRDGSGDAGIPWSDYVEMVPMNDSVRLKTEMYFPPDATGRLSAVLIRDPYGYSATDDPVWNIQYLLGYLRKRGYVLVVQNSRGQNGSEGEFVPLADEYSDGGQAVDWVLSQAWSNGRVAAFGPSYLGYTAVAAAAANPRVTVAIVDGAPLGGFDGWPGHRGGVGVSNGIIWWAPMEEGFHPNIDIEGVTTNHFPAQTLDEALLGAPFTWHRDIVDAFSVHGSPFWLAQSLRGRLDGYCVPTIHIQAYNEYADDPSEIFGAVVHGCQNAQSLQKMVFTDVLHGETTFDMYGDFDDPGARDNPSHAIIDRFLARYLDGADDNLADIPLLTYYDYGTDSWKSLDDWPPATSQLTFRLGAGEDLGAGELCRGLPADDSPVSYTYDPETQDPCGSSWVVAYFTGEVTQDFTFIGRPLVHLEASSSATDTEFWVILHELPPGASEWRYVTYGGVRARYRKGWESPTLLVPGRRTTFELELDRRVHTFQAGTLITLGTSSNYCGLNENPNSGETIGKETYRMAATQTVFLDGATGSSITFDVLQE